PREWLLGLLFVSPRDDTERARRGQSLGHAKPDSAVPAGYKSDPILQAENCHRDLPFAVRRTLDCEFAQDNLLLDGTIMVLHALEVAAKLLTVQGERSNGKGKGWSCRMRVRRASAYVRL